MEIKFVEAAPGNEVNALSDSKYPEGFYISNDQLWLKDKVGVVNFIWSGLQSYLNSPLEPAKDAERGDTISEHFLLKVLAIAKEPALIKDI
jgi:hypothetical protein